MYLLSRFFRSFANPFEKSYRSYFFYKLIFVTSLLVLQKNFINKNTSSLIHYCVPKFLAMRPPRKPRQSATYSVVFSFPLTFGALQKKIKRAIEMKKILFRSMPEKNKSLVIRVPCERHWKKIRFAHNLKFSSRPYGLPSNIKFFRWIFCSQCFLSVYSNCKAI